MANLSTTGVIFTLRIPREFSEQINEIAAREHEKATVVIRRLLRSGLATETRSGESQSLDAA